MITIRDAMTDPALFGKLFAGDTWAAWRALLCGFYGLDLSKKERQIFKAVTGRLRAPQTPHDELWMVIGRRGGKSNMAALIGVFEAFFRDHSDKLAPGEVATVFCVAADRRQARVVLRYITGLIESCPMLEKMVIRQQAESIELSNRTVIEVGTCNVRALRGYTLAAAVLDEIAFWYADGAKPDKEVVASIRPALATLGGPLVALSSPYARRGMLFDTFRRHHGQDGRVLVAKAPSRTMNPSLPQRVVDEALAEDASAAGAEYLAEFRKDVEEFASLEVIQACIEPGCRERPKVGNIRYSAFVDPSGGSQDSMTLGIAHREGERVILDAVREIKPPFSPESAVDEFCELLKLYRCREVTGDRYAGEWPREQFRKRGITYRISERTRSDIYRDLLPLLNSQTVELLDNDRLVAQLNGLERRTSRAGRDAIDHGPGGHDDLINAAAGAIVHCGIYAKKLAFGNIRMGY